MFDMPYCFKCGEEFSSNRAALGYKTCLEHGEPKKQFLAVPVNKSNYVVGTLEELKSSYMHKGPRL
jgi:hypothetical protein